jgi:hypothetical protein
MRDSRIDPHFFHSFIHICVALANPTLISNRIRTIMFALTNKPDMGARLYSGLINLATDQYRGTDVMKVIMHMAGVLVETYLVFDHPDEAMEASFDKLSKLLGCEPLEGIITTAGLPPAHIIDFETERGRLAARVFFEEWLDCEFEFHDLMLTVIQNVMMGWEEEGQMRAESFRLLVECVKCCMAFEIAAQELCDVVIDHKVAREGWSLGDCIASLSAVAGRRLALSLGGDTCALFSGSDLPDNLDRVVYVMTQEAVRLGVPAGSDWRLGLAANDVPVSAPMNLILGIEPYCSGFFTAIRLKNQYAQAVACAKAAGRMLAVAAGGEVPEIEPAIAKPLAMAAITETYKSVCMEHVLISL